MLLQQWACTGMAHRLFIIHFSWCFALSIVTYFALECKKLVAMVLPIGGRGEGLVRVEIHFFLVSCWYS